MKIVDCIETDNFYVDITIHVRPSSYLSIEPERSVACRRLRHCEMRFKRGYNQDFVENVDCSKSQNRSHKPERAEFLTNSRSLEVIC